MADTERKLPNGSGLYPALLMNSTASKDPRKGGFPQYWDSYVRARAHGGGPAGNKAAVLPPLSAGSSSADNGTWRDGVLRRAVCGTAEWQLDNYDTQGTRLNAPTRPNAPARLNTRTRPNAPRIQAFAASEALSVASE